METEKALTPEQASELGHIQLLLDGHLGIYLPQSFAEQFARYLKHDSADTEDIKILLSGPDHEHYWEAWDCVEQMAILHTDGGSDLYLYIGESGDLFTVDASVEIEW